MADKITSGVYLDKAQITEILKTVTDPTIVPLLTDARTLINEKEVSYNNFTKLKELINLYRISQIDIDTMIQIMKNSGWVSPT